MLDNEQNEVGLTDEALRLAKMLRLVRLSLFGMYSDSSGQLADDLEIVIRFISDATSTLDGMITMLGQAERTAEAEAHDAMH